MTGSASSTVAALRRRPDLLTVVIQSKWRLYAPSSELRRYRTLGSDWLRSAPVPPLSLILLSARGETERERGWCWEWDLQGVERVEVSGGGRGGGWSWVEGKGGGRSQALPLFFNRQNRLMSLSFFLLFFFLFSIFLGVNSYQFILF